MAPSSMPACIDSSCLFVTDLCILLRFMIDIQLEKHDQSSSGRESGRKGE